MDKRPLKVFLCHASADKPKVRELYRTLKRRGVQPWLDAEDLIPGQNWEVEIPKALLSSDAIIICLTPNSVDKEGYVQKEIKFALDKAMEMPEGRIFIIPARLEECDLPFSLRQYQAVNLYEKAGYTKLMRALKLRASQLERVTVQLPKAGETIAEVKKVVEEKKPPEPKEEKPESKTPKPPVEKVGVGGDVKDSVIVSGSGNVINIGEQKKPEPEKPQPKKTKSSRKPNTAIIVALIGLAGTIGAALISSTSFEKWFSTIPTETVSATIIATLTSRPTIASQTIEPSRTPTKSFTPTATSLPTEIRDAKGVLMELVPVGDFIMGVGDSQETVYLNAFYIDKYEITNGLYKICVDENVCQPPRRNNSAFRTFYFLNPDFYNYPVVNVDWNMASSYCDWRGARLPTEAEWEKAARGTSGRSYPWGENIDCQKANYGGCVMDTTEIGSYENGKSPYGIYDLGGNVTEWTADQSSNNTELYVLKGGDWSTHSSNMLIALVFLRYGDSYGERMGFRCAKDGNP